MSIQEVSRDSGAWRQLRLAEGLRRDGQAARAFALFESVLNDDTSALSRRQLRWARAHAGAAACAAFEPYSNDSHFLDSAETRLREALELGPSWDPQTEPLTRDGMTEVNYSWAWARLGEVYRFQGNLPGLYFAGDHDVRDHDVRDHDVPRLTARNGADAYAKGRCCFRRALCQEPHNGWASAHLGALYLNERRYRSDPKHAQTALALLKTAARDQDHLNLWTQTHIGCAHFLLGIDKAWALSCRLKDEPPSRGPAHLGGGRGIEDGAGALDAEHLLFALFYTVMGWHAAPDLLKHSLQPGAVELDPTFAILYDLIDILPHTRGKHRGALLECARQFARTQVSPAVDAFLPGSAQVRLEYFRAYLRFSSVDATADCGGSIEDHVREIVDQAGVIREGLGDAPLSMRAGNGMLSGVLSMMLVLMKAGALLQAHSRQRPSEGLATLLESYNQVLPVLRHRSGSIQQLSKLYSEGHIWLLSPIWTFGLHRTPDVLRDLLIINDVAPLVAPRRARRIPKENNHVEM